ncbi:MAG: OmpA family protein [Chlorobi bacterium]|nr:OmpA family protein [Chlorobiota bacterium]
MKSAILSAVLLIGLTITLMGQIVIDTTNPIQFGIYAHGALTRHRTGSFTQIGDVDKPPVPFDDAWGDGISFGALVNSPLSSLITANQTTASIHFALRLGFALQSARLAALEQQRFLVAGIPTDGFIAHRITASFASFGANAMIEYTPPFHDNIRFHLGGRLAWVYAAKFRQTESIEVPGASVVFVGGDVVRRTIEADIPVARKHEASTIAGVSYNIPIAKRFAIVPEMFINIPVVGHAYSMKWRSYWICGGVSVKVTIPTSKPTVRDTLIERDTVVKTYPELATDTVLALSIEYRTVVNETDQARYEFVHRRELYERRIPKQKDVQTASLTLELYERMPDSTLVALDTLRCREIVWTDFHPILPYLFFDYGSSSLDLHYHQLTRYDADHYQPVVDLDQMNTYYNVLNIVGFGLRQNPNTRLRIKGCISRREMQQIPHWQLLAQSRAETIARYFEETWGIERSRVKLLPVGLPQKMSSERHDDGIAENQRVELYSDDNELMQPVMMRDTMLQSSSTHLRLSVHVVSPTPIVRWNVSVEQARRVLYKNSGMEECPKLLDIELDNDMMRRLQRSQHEPLVVRMSIEQEGKGVHEYVRAIPLAVESLEQLRSRQEVTEVDRYIIMLFDAGKATPSPQSRAVITYVRKRLSTGSIVSIIGSTDRTGSLRYNLELSQQRADAVAKLLEYPIDRALGIGPDMRNYDNNRPEGRFHARTVKIEVEHPRPSRAYLDRQ